MTRIVETALVSTTGKLATLPDPTLPEVAFAGRSNVGKSSLLNALCGRKSLFKVSRSPGRTRTIVHVKARLETGAELYLVDLPGFGYARVSKQMSRAWSPLIARYLRERATLHLVAVLVDARRGLEAEESDLLRFLAESGLPAMLVATKLDRLPKSRQGAALAALEGEIDAGVIGTSSQTRQGVHHLLSRLVTACGLA